MGSLKVHNSDTLIQTEFHDIMFDFEVDEASEYVPEILIILPFY